MTASPPSARLATRAHGTWARFSPRCARASMRFCANPIPFLPQLCGDLVTFLRQPRRFRLLPAFAAVVSSVLLLAGCTSEESGAESQAVPSSISAPTSTGKPADPAAILPGSSVTGTPPKGLDIAVVAPSDPDGEELRGIEAIRQYSATYGGSVTLYEEPSPVASVEAAVSDRREVVVTVGPRVVGAIDLISAANLDVAFLVLGVQLAEPTENVVAVIWPGAEDRAVFADEVLTFTRAEEFADAATAAGLSALWSELGGHIIRIP